MKNIEACVEDASLCENELQQSGSEEEFNGEQAAVFADLQMPEAPQRKRDWKSLSKTLRTRIDRKLDSHE